AFKAICIYQEHDALLQDNHWIWVDSAYVLEKWCIPSFKKPWNGCLMRDQKTFNFNLSHICVHVEHAFAALKVHFQSLKELYFQINLHWVRCCLILHNMIIHFKEQHKCSTLRWAIREGQSTLHHELED
ncbi:hypothetical protein BDR04DRAFT_965656, partial [Suillus decipiens]